MTVAQVFGKDVSLSCAVNKVQVGAGLHMLQLQLSFVVKVAHS